MAAVTHAGTTWNTTAGSKTVTATPAVDDLIVVVAASSGLAGGTTSVTDDQSGTYTQVDSDRTGFSTTGVLTVWVRNARISSAVSTVFTAAQVGSSGGGLSVFRVSGMSRAGSAAVRSNGGQSSGTAATTPAPVLNQTPLSTNPIIGAVANGTSPAGLTPRTGYTEASDLGYATPTTGLESMFDDSGETSATITWGGNSASTFASVAIELDASPLKDTAATQPETPAETDWSGTAASLTTTVGGQSNDGVLHWQSGDTVYLIALTASDNTTLGSPSTSGSNLGAFTAPTGFTNPLGGAGNSLLYAYKATATGTGSGTFTINRTAGSDDWGFIVWIVRGSDGQGAIASNVGSGKTVSLVRSDDHSLVLFGGSDFAAGAAPSVWTPSTGVNVRQASVSGGAGVHTVGVADWDDQGSAGTTSYGVSTGWGAGPITKLAIEVLGTIGGAPKSAPPPPPVRRMLPLLVR